MMSIFSNIADAAKDIFHGAKGFASGLLDGTTKGNSIGSLIGIVAGVAFAITGFVAGGWVPALVMGVGLGAACGVIGGAVIGSFVGAAKHGHEMTLEERAGTTLTETQAPTPEMTPATPELQQTAARKTVSGIAAAPKEGGVMDSPVSFAPAPQRKQDVSFQSKLALEREAAIQQEAPAR